MKKKISCSKTILGTMFICNCGKTFIAGPKGMAALTERVTKHAGIGHYKIPAVKPKVGMVYQGLPHMPYTADQDPKEWYESVIRAGGMIPEWKLVKV